MTDQNKPQQPQDKKNYEGIDSSRQNPDRQNREGSDEKKQDNKNTNSSATKE